MFNKISNMAFLVFISDGYSQMHGLEPGSPTHLVSSLGLCVARHSCTSARINVSFTDCSSSLRTQLHLSLIMSQYTQSSPGTDLAFRIAEQQTGSSISLVAHKEALVGIMIQRAQIRFPDSRQWRSWLSAPRTLRMVAQQYAEI